MMGQRGRLRHFGAVEILRGLGDQRDQAIERDGARSGRGRRAAPAIRRDKTMQRKARHAATLALAVAAVPPGR